MSKIRVNVDYPIYDGLNLTFTAPCDCTSADGLRVYYPNGNRTFSFCDAHNRNIYGIGNVFSEGASVKVILDVTNGRAYIQNADYNTYIDGLIRKYGKVSYGTYVGNGATGEGAVSLSFDFEPGLLIVGCDNFSNVGANYIHPVNNFVWVNGQSSIVTQTYYEDSTLTGGKVTRCNRLAFTVVDNTVSWVAYTIRYSESGETISKADEHFNKLDTTYYYLAIGKNDIDTSDDEEITATVAEQARLFFEENVVQTTGDSETKVMSQKATTEAIEKYFSKSEGSINLFDKTQPYEDGLLNTGGSIIAQVGSRIYTLPVTVGKTYTFPIYYAQFGWDGAFHVCCYNADKEYLGYIVASHPVDNNHLVLTVTDKFDETVAFVKVNVATMDANNVTYIENYMFVEGTEYPSEYIPYVPAVIYLKEDVIVSKSYSPLYKKKVVFTGDSICNASSDETGVSGWAQRIGDKYLMNWENVAISGGTITNKTTLPTSPFCIAETDFGKNPDYIILEGGVNDADLIGGVKDADGNFAPDVTKFGTYDLKNYGYTAFNTNTFCGAIEHLFKRVTTDYAGAKIGFIIAHKMGGWDAGASYDYTAKNSLRRFYFETIINLCKKWGIPYIDLWDGCYLNPLNQSHNAGSNPFYSNGDMQHLTARGYDYITPMIEKWMETL